MYLKKSEWHLIQIGSPVWGPAEDLLKKAQIRLSRHVNVQIVEPLKSGLEHEAGRPRDRAELLIRTLSEGAVAVLANGPCYTSLTAAEPTLNQLLPFLPDGLRGTVIGSMSHAHFLSTLSKTQPELNILMGPPVIEVIGALEDDNIPERAVIDLVNLYSSGPPDGSVTPKSAHVGLYLQDPSSLPPNLSPLRQIDPIAVRSGKAHGPVFAGNLMPMAMAAGGPDWPDCNGSILIWEASQLRLLEIDLFLQHLRNLGLLSSLGAMLVGVPILLIESAKTLSLTEIVRRATEGTVYPVLINAFVGTGTPSPLLRIGASAGIAVDPRGAEIKWD